MQRTRFCCSFASQKDEQEDKDAQKKGDAPQVTSLLSRAAELKEEASKITPAQKMATVGGGGGGGANFHPRLLKSARPVSTTKVHHLR